MICRSWSMSNTTVLHKRSILEPLSMEPQSMGNDLAMAMLVAQTCPRSAWAAAPTLEGSGPTALCIVSILSDDPRRESNVPNHQPVFLGNISVESTCVLCKNLHFWSFPCQMCHFPLKPVTESSQQPVALQRSVDCSTTCFIHLSTTWDIQQLSYTIQQLKECAMHIGTKWYQPYIILLLPTWRGQRYEGFCC